MAARTVFKNIELDREGMALVLSYSSEAPGVELKHHKKKFVNSAPRARWAPPAARRPAARAHPAPQSRFPFDCPSPAP
jgi:hypothetical protein